MVSGFFTSPCDHSMIFCGEAREIFTLSNLTGPFGFEKKLNSSSTKITLFYSISRYVNIILYGLQFLPDDAQPMASSFLLLKKFNIKTQPFEFLDQNME